MGSGRILIVDDEAHVVAALSQVLAMPRGGAYQVECCHTADAALARLSQAPFDLLITDLVMPGMDGLELLQKARQLCPAMRSILITGYGSPDVERQATELASAYLTKPFTLRQFVATVHCLDPARDGPPPEGAKRDEPRT